MKELKTVDDEVNERSVLNKPQSLAQKNEMMMKTPMFRKANSPVHESRMKLMIGQFWSTNYYPIPFP